MFRKSLALLATGLILFAALLFQMSIAQAAAPGQTAPDTEEPQPLAQPLRIRINQAIPLTLSVPASLLANSAPVTRPLTATGSLTGALTEAVDAAGDLGESSTATPTLGARASVTATGAATETAAADLADAADTLTATEVLTDAADTLAEAAGDAVDAATAALTDTLADTLTGTLTDTGTGALDDTDLVTGADALTETDTLTDTEADVLSAMPMASIPVTLELSLDLVVTNTLTTTVGTSVTLQLADLTTRTLPVSVTLAPQPDGEIYVELLPVEEVETPEPTAEATPELTATEEITATPQVTETEAVTPTDAETPTVEVTATVQPPSGLPVVNTTATTTANLRAGPATTFDLVGQVGPGAAVAVAGISEDGQWYLLDGGAWIATFLTADAALPNLPIATQELIDQATGNAPVAPTPAVTTTAVLTPEAAATPVPPAVTAPVTPTTTTDANLRAGPGTEFPIIGGTITGQALNIVGRNADGTWFRLDNTGWVFGELVANPPALETVPVVNADGTPVEAPAATATPAAGGGLPLPTPTPAAAAGTGGIAAAAATTGTVATTGTTGNGANAAYLTSVQTIITRYDGIAQTMDSLIAEATGNNAALTTPEWANRVGAAVSLLRTTSATVGELEAPGGFAAAQADLIAAAQQYTAAGTALNQAATTGAVAQLEIANTAIEQANASLTAVEQALAGAQ
jgi:uncharacterized protein YraI